jgi:hypothetical protein
MDQEDGMEDQSMDTRATLKDILEGAPVWNSQKDVSDDEQDTTNDSEEIERLKREAELVNRSDYSAFTYLYMCCIKRCCVFG